MIPVTDEEELNTELMQTHIDALPNTYGAPNQRRRLWV